MKSIIGQKIVVAMSGGIDSTVSALIMKKKGFDVIGATINLGTFCCNPQLLNNVKSFCKSLKIKHYVLDCEIDFKKNIVDYFVESYINGETPNPCAKCNKEIKFGKLIGFAKSLGATKLITGHYARIMENRNFFELHKGIDETKDQSYFLSLLTQEQLSFVEFPLGDKRKKEDVREFAKRQGLDISEKKESQDVCFVPSGNYVSIIKEYRPNYFKKGKIISIDGSVLGEHNGIMNYTIGQRKGLGIAYSEPLYVVRIDKEKNEVIVGTEKYLYSNRVSLRDINLLDQRIEINKPVQVLAKLRSTHKGEYGVLKVKKGKMAELILNKSVKAIAKGQVCTCYDGTRVILGGWIT